MTKILITGNVIEGMTFYGPYDEHEGADWSDVAHRAGAEADWWIADLHAPKGPTVFAVDNAALRMEVANTLTQEAPAGLVARAAALMSEGGENPEYDRALAELVIEQTPGLSFEDKYHVLAIMRGLKGL